MSNVEIVREPSGLERHRLPILLGTVAVEGVAALAGVLTAAAKGDFAEAAAYVAGGIAVMSGTGLVGERVLNRHN